MRFHLVCLILLAACIKGRASPTQGDTTTPDPEAIAAAQKPFPCAATELLDHDGSCVAVPTEPAPCATSDVRLADGSCVEKRSVCGLGATFDAATQRCIGVQCGAETVLVDGLCFATFAVWTMDADVVEADELGPDSPPLAAELPPFSGPGDTVLARGVVSVNADRGVGWAPPPDVDRFSLTVTAAGFVDVELVSDARGSLGFVMVVNGAARASPLSMAQPKRRVLLPHAGTYSIFVAPTAWLEATGLSGSARGALDAPVHYALAVTQVGPVTSSAVLSGSGSVNGHLLDAGSRLFSTAEPGLTASLAMEDTTYPPSIGLEAWTQRDTGDWVLLSAAASATTERLVWIEFARLPRQADAFVFAYAPRAAPVSLGSTNLALPFLAPVQLDATGHASVSLTIAGVGTRALAFGGCQVRTGLAARSGLFILPVTLVLDCNGAPSATVNLNVAMRPYVVAPDPLSSQETIVTLGTLSAGDVVVVEASAPVSGWLRTSIESPSPDATLRIAAIQDAETDLVFERGQPTPVLAQPVLFFVRNDSQQSVANVQLRSTIVAQEADFETEPNDTLALAQTLPIPGTVSGFIDSSYHGDRDVYVLSASVLTLVRVTLHQSNFAPIFAQYVLDGVISPVPASDTFTLPVATAGGHVLMLTRETNNVTTSLGTYYRLSATIRSDPFVVEVEPNENVATATPEAFDALIIGKGDHTSDVDCYAFESPGNKVVSLIDDPEIASIAAPTHQGPGELTASPFINAATWEVGTHILCVNAGVGVWYAFSLSAL